MRWAHVNSGLNSLRTLTARAARVSLKRGGSWRPPASPPARSCGPTAACPDFSPRDRPQGRESARTAALVSISTTRCVQPTEVASCSRYGVTMLKFGSAGSSTARIDGSASASPVTSMPSDAQPSPGQCNLGCKLHPDSAAFTRTGHTLSRPVEHCEGCPVLAGVRNLDLDDPAVSRPDLHCNFEDRSIGCVGGN